MMGSVVEWQFRKPKGVVDTYFDTTERRQVIQAVVVGVAVWAVVLALEITVHHEDSPHEPFLAPKRVAGMRGIELTEIPLCEARRRLAA